MAERGYGRGTLHQRSADGLWVGRIDLGGSPRKRKVISGKDHADVERRMDEWLAEHMPHRLEPTTPGTREQHMARAREIARHTAAEWREKAASAGGLCRYCRRSVSLGGVKDHYIPVSRGGSDGIDNVVLACWDCNAAKADLMPDDFLAWAAADGFFDKPQRIAISTSKGNRRIPPEVAALMRIPREERARLFKTGRLAARVKREMERM